MPICLSLTDSFVGKNKSPVRINNELYICNISRYIKELVTDLKITKIELQANFYLVKIGQELTKLWPFSRFNRQSESESAVNRHDQ